MKVRMIALAALDLDGESIAAGSEFRCDKATARRLVRERLAIQPDRYVAPEPEEAPAPVKPKRGRKSAPEPIEEPASEPEPEAALPFEPLTEEDPSDG